MEFTKGWEQLSSSSSTKTAIYSNASNLPSNTKVYGYPDGKSFSIGWGTYNTLSDGTKIMGRSFSITKEQADLELKIAMKNTDAVLRKVITNKNLTDTQYAALLDYSYNAGAYSLSINYPNVLKAINRDEDATGLLSAAITDAGTGNKLTQLENRRKDEIALWNGKYNSLYHFYLKNSQGVNYAIIGMVIIALTGYLYYLKNKKII